MTVRERNMKRYFVKQKMVGILLIILGVISAILTIYAPDSLLAALIFIGGGIGLCFTKKMVVTDKYYDYIKKEKDRRL